MYVGKTIPERPIPFEEFNPDYIAGWLRDVMYPTLVTDRQRQILQNFIDHATVEAQGDYEALMATCSRKSQDYRRWGQGDDGKMDGLQPSSYEELEVFYGQLISFNVFNIHLEPEKCIVGNDTIVLEGNVHQIYHGSMMPVAFGIEPEDPNAVYMLTIRMCLFFIFDEDGMGIGEQSYTNGDPRPDSFVKMPDEFVPQRFWDAQKKLEEAS